MGREWLERFARLGYGAKGVVYLIVGLLAFKVASGNAGQAKGSKGALTELLHQPFGTALLGAVSLGLFAYVGWRWIQAFADTEQKGRDLKGIGGRFAYFISGAIYAGLAVSAAGMVLGKSRGAGDDSPRGLTAWLLDKPFGQVLVGIGALIVFGVAVKEIHNAYKKKFCAKLELGSLTPQRRDLAVKVCRFGLAARGAVFILIASFLMRAAINANPGEAKGLGEALTSLTRHPFGAVLVGIAAAGLIAYALYLFVQAFYRRIPVPDPAFAARRLARAH